MITRNTAKLDQERHPWREDVLLPPHQAARPSWPVSAPDSSSEASAGAASTPRKRAARRRHNPSDSPECSGRESPGRVWGFRRSGEAPEIRRNPPSRPVVSVVFAAPVVGSRLARFARSVKGARQDSRPRCCDYQRPRTRSLPSLVGKIHPWKTQSKLEGRYANAVGDPYHIILCRFSTNSPSDASVDPEFAI